MLIQSAEVLQAVRRAAEFGVRAGEPEVDWPAMQVRKDSVVSPASKLRARPQQFRLIDATAGSIGRAARARCRRSWRIPTIWA